MKAKTSFSLKDQLFNRERVTYLARLIEAAHPPFRKKPFVRKVVAAFPQLELKERIHHIAECLKSFLPDDFPTALAILVDSLPPELDPDKSDDDFGQFILSPFSHFVAMYGCTAEHLDISLRAQREMTKRFSAEHSIRYFINAFPKQTMTFLNKCARDKNYHVRRLASEGSRAKLPWSQNLTIHYREPLPILNALYADKTRYVTRSVANHMNDISKVEPDLVVRTLREWRKSGKQDEKEMEFITKHALRTLVKEGNQNALSLLGFGGKPAITITRFSAETPVVAVGEALEFALDFTAHKKQNLILDYEMLFASDGRKNGRKIFKLKQFAVSKGEVVKLRKKHPMRLMTTRRLYAGVHKVTLQVNGRQLGTLEFDLVAD